MVLAILACGRVGARQQGGRKRHHIRYAVLGLHATRRVRIDVERLILNLERHAGDGVLHFGALVPQVLSKAAPCVLKRADVLHPRARIAARSRQDRKRVQSVRGRHVLSGRTLSRCRQ